MLWVDNLVGWVDNLDGWVDNLERMLDNGWQCPDRCTGRSASVLCHHCSCRGARAGKTDACHGHCEGCHQAGGHHCSRMNRDMKLATRVLNRAKPGAAWSVEVVTSPHSRTIVTCTCTTTAHLRQGLRIHSPYTYAIISCNFSEKCTHRNHMMHTTRTTYTTYEKRDNTQRMLVFAITAKSRQMVTSPFANYS